MGPEKAEIYIFSYKDKKKKEHQTFEKKKKRISFVFSHVHFDQYIFKKIISSGLVSKPISDQHKMFKDTPASI